MQLQPPNMPLPPHLHATSIPQHHPKKRDLSQKNVQKWINKRAITPLNTLAAALLLLAFSATLAHASRPATAPSPATTRAATRPSTTKPRFTDRQTATLEMAHLKTALDRFFLDTGRFPSSTEGTHALLSAPSDVKDRWKGPYVTDAPHDPWGTPYLYAFPGRLNPSHFDLSSAGPDKKEGTRDDLRAP